MSRLSQTKNMLITNTAGPFAKSFAVVNEAGVHVSGLSGVETAVLQSLNKEIPEVDYNDISKNDGWEDVYSDGSLVEATVSNNVFSITSGGFYRFKVAAGTGISIGITK